MNQHRHRTISSILLYLPRHTHAAESESRYFHCSLDFILSKSACAAAPVAPEHESESLSPIPLFSNAWEGVRARINKINLHVKWRECQRWWCTRWVIAPAFSPDSLSAVARTQLKAICSCFTGEKFLLALIFSSCARHEKNEFCFWPARSAVVAEASCVEASTADNYLRALCGEGLAEWCWPRGRREKENRAVAA